MATEYFVGSDPMMGQTGQQQGYYNPSQSYEQEEELYNPAPYKSRSGQVADEIRRRARMAALREQQRYEQFIRQQQANYRRAMEQMRARAKQQGQAGAGPGQSGPQQAYYDPTPPGGFAPAPGPNQIAPGQSGPQQGYYDPPKNTYASDYRNFNQPPVPPGIPDSQQPPSAARRQREIKEDQMLYYKPDPPLNTQLMPPPGPPVINWLINKPEPGPDIQLVPSPGSPFVNWMINPDMYAIDEGEAYVPPQYAANPQNNVGVYAPPLDYPGAYNPNVIANPFGNVGVYAAPYGPRMEFEYNQAPAHYAIEETPDYTGGGGYFNYTPWGYNYAKSPAEWFQYMTQWRIS